MSTPDELYNTLITLGEDWADKNSAADLLKENRKSIRAQVALQYLGKAKSIAQCELMAESDVDYIRHIGEMVKAERAANIARVNYDAWRTFIDLLRSKEATERAAFQMR